MCTGAGGGTGPRSGEGSEGSREGLGGFGAEPGQVQQGSGEGSGEGLGGFGVEPGQVQQFPAFGFAARFRKMCKNKTLRLLGIPPKLIFFSFALFSPVCIPNETSKTLGESQRNPKEILIRNPYRKH